MRALGNSPRAAGVILIGLLCWLSTDPLPAQESANSEVSTKLADLAVGDLLSHWWVGGAEEGHIVPTHGGYPAPDRGAFWERFTIVQVLAGATGLPALGHWQLKQRIGAEWRHDSALYQPAEFERCGPGSISPWSDDAGWALLYYLTVHRQCGEVEALAHAKGLCRAIQARWLDREAGGLWYNDRREVKSLYAVSWLYGCLDLFALTGQTEFQKMAMAEYGWIEAHLKRPDHLYWCDYRAGPPSNPAHPLGPVGIERPNDIQPAGSVVYLGGNMGMNACQAYLYRLTNEEVYREAALSTASAIEQHLVDRDGRLINDRDAFTNGIFACLWAEQIPPLADPDDRAQAVLQKTAAATAALRTGVDYQPANGPGGAGFYPADWDGGRRWEQKGNWSNMLHVTATSTSLIVAGALTKIGSSTKQ